MTSPAGITVAGVKSTLKSLRTRSGLQRERLATTELALDVLERLEPVAALTTCGVEPADAIIRTVREAAQLLPVTERLIVDAALCLRLGSSSGMDDERYDDDLSNRRDALLRHWDRLHLEDGMLSAPSAPSARALRLDREDTALNLLAAALVREEATARTDVPDDEIARPTSRQRAVVIGAAVLDLAFQVADLPTINNTSAQAADFASSPGGKGLNQAVGMTRLGADARLIAAIGSDPVGMEIVRYLRDEMVDTTLLQVRENATTPRTLVISSTNSQFWHLGWKNEHEIRLTGEFLRSDEVREAIAEAAVIVLTLEPARESLRSILRLVGENKHAPLVLTASPPIDLHEPPLSADELRKVDFLVASKWELRMLLQETGPPDDFSDQDVLNRLFMAGVGTICVVESRYCTILRLDAEPLTLPETIPHDVISITDPSASKDAFTSALATRIAQKDGPVTDDDYRFAYLAMLVAGSRFGTSRALPFEAEIVRYEQTLMRQAATVSARETSDD